MFQGKDIDSVRFKNEWILLLSHVFIV